MAKQSKQTKPGVEEGLAHLEEMVQQLESGKLSLEDAMGIFEKGMKLSTDLSTRLAEMGKRIEVLMTDGEGGVEARPFADVDPADEDE